MIRRIFTREGTARILVGGYPTAEFDVGAPNCAVSRCRYFTMTTLGQPYSTEMELAPEASSSSQ